MTRRASPSKSIDARAALESAVALHRAGKLAEAAAAYRQVLAADPTQADALSLLGQIVHRQGDSPQALELMTRARKLRPDSATIVFNLGRLYLDLRDWRNAVQATEDAVRRAPDNAAAHCNLGVALTWLDRAADGEVSIRKSLDLAPDNALSWSALGMALARQNNMAAARDAFEKALAHDPALAEARFNLAEMLLGEMDFARGWPLFAARADSDRASFATGGVMPAHIPLWRGEDISAKTILVWGEQGLGDQILFAGLLPDLCRRAGKVVLACAPRLVPLLQRSFPQIKLIAQDDAIDVALARCSIDCATALGSLGGHLRPDRAAFLTHGPYLKADPARVAALKARYKNLSNDKPVVGVSWRSGRIDIGAAKSVPFDLWSRLLQVEGAVFLNLQYGETGSERAQANARGLTLHHDPEIDAMKDVDGQAAQIAALDLVVSASNTTVHLAGGLGVPVWTLAPVGAGRMWYWFAPKDPWAPSLWYPAMRVYHQSAPGHWQPLVDRVAGDLAAQLASP